ncbi:hypothetical protein V5O48_018904 [Marasmius crinis-equi]|uniref:Uncharacterized protein n=1 Tax=Marasmius crinis-equi TaxID=585013 RepID=A0ABR3EJW7_9AGAR
MAPADSTSTQVQPDDTTAAARSQANSHARKPNTRSKTGTRNTKNNTTDRNLPAAAPSPGSQRPRSTRQPLGTVGNKNPVENLSVEEMARQLSEARDNFAALECEQLNVLALREQLQEGSTGMGLAVGSGSSAMSSGVQPGANNTTEHEVGNDGQTEKPNGGVQAGVGVGGAEDGSNSEDDPKKNGAGREDQAVVELQVQLQREQAANAELCQQLQAGGSKADTVAKPTGKYNIRDEMKLGGSHSKDIYLLTLDPFFLQDSCRDLFKQSGMDAKIPYKDQPLEERSKYLIAMRTREPFLARFTDDWATIAIVNSILKYSRQKLYKKSAITHPEKYNYLVTNAAKQDHSTSRRRTALPSNKRKQDGVPSSGSKKKQRLSADNGVEQGSGEGDECSSGEGGDDDNE